MKQMKIFAAIAAVAMFLGSCQDYMFNVNSAEGSVQGFTIKATYGDPKSKAAFDTDGLTLLWTPGDELYLVDPEGVNPTVTLTTDITDSVKTAKFHTDKLLATGKYLVLFGQDDLDVDKGIEISKNIADLNSQVCLYGEVEVTMGDTEADVVLHHLFAMLSFQILNLPSGQTSISLGMAAGLAGLQNLGKGEIGFDGLTTSYSGGFQTGLGYVDGYGADDRGRTLIAPVNLSYNPVVFYLTYHDGSTRRVYTFSKDGIDIQAGKSYAITLDLEKATSAVAFEKSNGASIINNADDFFAAALLSSGNSFILNKDIDFSGKLFLPLRASSLKGNGHTLSNIQCALKDCSYVGVLSEGNAHDLNVTNSLFSGKDCVGAITGSGYGHNCSCSDIKVDGNMYVGGIAGRSSYITDSCSISGISTINGKEYVGGFVGFTSYPVKNCVAKGEVIIVSCNDKGHYAGGIAASSEGGAIECGFEGNVYGGTYVGGVCGKGSCSKCYCVGSVEGMNYVGGVSGTSDCTDCYFIGELSTPALSGAGISGSNISTAVSNCYSCGTIITGIGICASPKEEYLGTNLTSLNLLYSGNNDYPENCGCNAEHTFLDKLDVINGNGAYLPICWPDNDAKCPLLAWQYEGFGSELSIPGFESVTW